ncbi:MAG: hypothetical protein ACO1SV_27485 [Fimbriimonas sp.]
MMADLNSVSPNTAYEMAELATTLLEKLKGEKSDKDLVAWAIYNDPSFRETIFRLFRVVVEASERPSPSEVLLIEGDRFVVCGLEWTVREASARFVTASCTMQPAEGTTKIEQHRYVGFTRSEIATMFANGARLVKDGAA